MLPVLRGVVRIPGFLPAALCVLFSLATTVRAQERPVDGGTSGALGAETEGAGQAIPLVDTQATGSEGDASEGSDDGRDSAEQSDEQSAQAAVVARLKKQTAQLEELLRGELDSDVSLSSVLPAPVDDPEVVSMQTARLRAYLDRYDGERSALAEAEAAIAKAEARGQKGRAAKLRKVLPTVSTEGLPVPVWEAMVARDRAFLRFLSRPKESRDALLAAHERTRAEAEADAAEERAATAEAQRREAELAQQSALDAARKARSEAERLLQEEKASLLGVAQRQLEQKSLLEASEAELRRAGERALELERRVEELLTRGGSAATYEGLYDEVQGRVGSARREFAEALRVSLDAVPRPAGTRLENVPMALDTAEVDALRQRVFEAADSLEQEREAHQAFKTRQLYQQTRRLEAVRLSLLPRISAERRRALTALSGAGASQAFSELAQIALLLRYHARVVTEWVSQVIRGGDVRRDAAWVGGMVGLKWLVILMLFLWWRRRAEPPLEALRKRLAKERRHGRGAQVPWLENAVTLLLRVHRPLQWLAVCSGLLWVLPEVARSQIEVRLLESVVVWNLGGAVLVSLVDGMASLGHVGHFDRRGASKRNVPQLRLQSLTLLGRTVVAFGLILSVTMQLVGKGTVYQWVQSLSWFVLLGIVVRIAHLWREVTFVRVTRLRRPNGFERWLAKTQTGVGSWPRFVLGAVYFFVVGALRRVRRWLRGFDLSRRVGAYLFRRQIDKVAAEKPEANWSDLAAHEFGALSPDALAAAPVWPDDNVPLRRLTDRVLTVGSGLSALVGPRGAGKSTLIQHVASLAEGIEVVDCPPTGVGALREAIAEALGVDGVPSWDACARAADSEGGPRALIIDNAHRLIHPVMGGLREFDELMGVAREHATRSAWVFVFNDVVFRFLECARGTRPLFDEVTIVTAMGEEPLVHLLQARCEEGGIAPRFEHLVEQMADASLDEEDREDASARAAAGFYRLLWDQSGGNPGVALHMLRRSLGVDAGGAVRARVLKVADVKGLEALPDPAVFVFRAVVQLEPAEREEVRKATNLGVRQVDTALRYGVAQGYLEEVDGRFRVTWNWFRTMTLFLQRRRLLPIMKV